MQSPRYISYILKIVLSLCLLMLVYQNEVTGAASTPTPSGASHRELAYVSFQSGGPPFHSTFWIYDFNTASRKFFFEIDEIVGSLHWSPDGKYLLFTTIPDQFRSRIYIVDATGKLIYKGR